LVEYSLTAVSTQMKLYHTVLTILLCPRSDTYRYGHINRFHLLTYLL